MLIGMIKMIIEIDQNQDTMIEINIIIIGMIMSSRSDRRKCNTSRGKNRKVCRLKRKGEDNNRDRDRQRSRGRGRYRGREKDKE